MLKNDLMKCGEEIVRILDVEEKNVFVVNCIRRTMPKWITRQELSDYVKIPEEEFLNSMEMCIPDVEELSAPLRKVVYERYTMISGILPFVSNKRMRSQLIMELSNTYEVSQNTIKNYLHQYLVFQNIAVLAPKERQEKQDLTQYEKNMRWALNKYYYSKDKQSISTVYTLLLKEKYCDQNGRLMERYPSIHQFRYFCRKTKKMQTYYISRNGLKDYQRNNRPLLGDGVQEFSSVGVGMLDGTVCDIYLVDDAGHLVGRPILVACVDAYSSFCYGYSLLWEGGVYSLRNLMLNVVSDKTEYYHLQ